MAWVLTWAVGAAASLAAGACISQGPPRGRWSLLARRSGVFNDLGSGSNVDLCVISKEGVEYKRNYELLQVGAGLGEAPLGCHLSRCAFYPRPCATEAATRVLLLSLKASQPPACLPVTWPACQPTPGIAVSPAGQDVPAAVPAAVCGRISP